MATTELEYTSLDEITRIHDALKTGFATGKTKPIAFRKAQLSQLAYMIKDNTSRFEAAFAKDLGRPVLESHFMELVSCINDAVEAYHNVEKWSRTENAPFSWTVSLLRPKVRKEPKGVVLIISPFNYPAWLCLGPLASAIAAGNAAVIKPSENTPAFSSLIAELFPKYLDSSLFRVVNGAVPETTKLLELQWNHILYTGNGKVGRIVAAAAAKHLTPTTLELGGKCPVFLDSECDLQLAARRIFWGKFVNSGQTCTAPDYVLTTRDTQEKFIKALSDVHKTFYPDGPLKSNSFARIISDLHFARLKSLLDNTKGNVALGGETDASQKFISPTVVRDVTAEDSLMSQEIFGPILPIVPINDWDAAIAFVNSRDHPLAVYVFTDNEKLKNKIFDSTQSGAAVANETTIHPGVSGLPFGGVGESGYGYHTGKYGFDIFTHFRATLESPKIFDAFMKNRYPPYTESKLKMLTKTLYTRLPPRNGEISSWKKWIPSLLCVALAIGLGARLTGTHINVLMFLQRLLSRK